MSRSEVVALAREVLGGNGVVTDFHVAKQFCDMEAIYTYEVRQSEGSVTLRTRGKSPSY